MKLTLSIALIGLMAVVATTNAAHHPQHAGGDTPAAVAAMTDGEVKKVDKGAGKFTIKHGPLNNLDMPAMTMVFRVNDPAMLDQVKVGDKVQFVAEKVGGQYTVTKIEPK